MDPVGVGLVVIIAICSVIYAGFKLGDKITGGPPAMADCLRDADGAECEDRDGLPDHYDESGPIESYIVRKRNGIRYYADDRVNYGEPTELYSRIPMRVFLNYADYLDNDVDKIAYEMGEDGMFVENSQVWDALIYAGRSAKPEEAADDGLIAR